MFKGKVVQEFSSSKEEKSDNAHYEDTNNDTKAEPIYKWAEIYEIFKNENYPSIPVKDKDYWGVYNNIKKFELHRVVSRPSILACVEIIYWILPRVNIEDHLITNIDEPEVMAYFQPTSWEVYYKFLTIKMHLIEEWLSQVQLDIYACIKR